FARASERLSETLGYTISLKSVNHRFLDLHMRLPSGTEPLEMQLRKALKENIGRGHIEVSLAIDRSAKLEAQYDEDLVAAYVAAFRNGAARPNVNDESDLNVVLRLQGVLTGDSRNTEDELKAVEAAVMRRVPALICVLSAMGAE